MGFIIPPAGQEYEGDGTDEGGNTVVDAQPGTFETLSAGSEIKSFDPQHPNANFGSFSKCMLRGIAMAGDVSYHTLTGDLESVNYSSARVGLLDERDGYTVLQDEFIRGFCEPVFRAWLMAQSVLGAIPLSIEEARTFDEVIWRARRWSWVDPQKEIGAAAQAVALRVRSRTQIVAEQGGEVGQTFKELSAEEQALEALDLATDVPAEPAPAVSGKQEQDDEDDEDDDSGEPEAPQRNGHLKPERFSRG
jgi:lambda family phage portal protein